MADPELVKILGQGSTAWNQWQKQQPEIEPDLRKADLHSAIEMQIYDTRVLDLP